MFEELYAQKHDHKWDLGLMEFDPRQSFFNFWVNNERKYLQYKYKLITPWAKKHYPPGNHHAIYL